MQFPIASCSLSYQPWWNPNGFSHPLKMEDSPTTKNDCDCDGHWIGFVGKKKLQETPMIFMVFTPWLPVFRFSQQNQLPTNPMVSMTIWKPKKSLGNVNPTDRFLPQTVVELGGCHLCIRLWLLEEYPPQLINHGLLIRGWHYGTAPC